MCDKKNTKQQTDKTKNMQKQQTHKMTKVICWPKYNILQELECQE